MLQVIALGAANAISANSDGQSIDQVAGGVSTMSFNPRLFSFIGGNTGIWQVTKIRTITGEGLADINALDIVSGSAKEKAPNATWSLQGVTSNDRYVTRVEKETLVANQQGLGRPDSNCGVLIPIRKNAAWWSLTQDERRSILEDESRHIAIGLEYLPAIARRLHHSRDLPESQGFDFLTWFEFADEHTELFDQLLNRLRVSKEWHFVDREVEFRFRRNVALEKR
jgi:hypothetical protein